MPSPRSLRRTVNPLRSHHKPLNKERAKTLILYRTAKELFVEHDNHAYLLNEISLDALFSHDDLHSHLSTTIANTAPDDQLLRADLQAPIEHQEVWASGVTYYRSRSARIEESKGAGGGDFYDRVYSAERPELFFKAVAP